MESICSSFSEEKGEVCLLGCKSIHCFYRLLAPPRIYDAGSHTGIQKLAIAAGICSLESCSLATENLRTGLSIDHYRNGFRESAKEGH